MTTPAAPAPAAPPDPIARLVADLEAEGKPSIAWVMEFAPRRAGRALRALWDACKDPGAMIALLAHTRHRRLDDAMSRSFLAMWDFLDTATLPMDSPRRARLVGEARAAREALPDRRRALAAWRRVYEEARFWVRVAQRSSGGARGGLDERIAAAVRRSVRVPPSMEDLLAVGGR